MKAELSSLRTASRRGLQEIFDGSIGSSSVLFPFGGATQGTPECGMAALLPALDRDAATASLMSFGYNPEIAQKSPFKGARAAVLESLARYVSLGGKLSTARLSLQEYFERSSSPEAWGKPLAALLAALEAQVELGTPAIGGKDSMSGTYRDPGNDRILNVPPTLVSFAAGVTDASRVSSAALSTAGDSPIVLFALPESGSPWETFRANCAALEAMRDAGMVRAASAVHAGGPLATLALMAFGNRVSLEVDLARLDKPVAPGSFIVELDPAAIASCLENLDEALAGCTNWNIIARTIKADSSGPQQAASAAIFRVVNSSPALEATVGTAAAVPLDTLRRLWEAPLSRVYPQTASGKSVADAAWPESGAASGKDPLALSLSAWRDGHGLPAIGKRAKPLVVLPVFPGTNCEWDMERAFRRAGAETKQVLFRNRSPEEVRESSALLARAISGAQILALSGGFSAGDEPEGSGKFIANALRAPAVAKEVNELVGSRDGLVLGICNGFQALIKLGLVPYGEIRECGPGDPTLTFNELGRHVSRMVTTRVMSNKSPWLALDPVDSLQTLPVSHGEGRLAVNAALGEELFEKGQVAFCYADENGEPTMREPWNPNGSAFAIEGLLSPDGRVLGKMGHSERVGPNVHKNIPASDAQRIFEAGVRWFA